MDTTKTLAKHKWGALIMAALALIVAFLLIAPTISVGFNDRANAADASLNEEASATGDNGTVISDRLKAHLDASKAPAVDCVEIIQRAGGTVTEGVYSLYIKPFLRNDEATADLLLWADSMSTPLDGANAVEKKFSLQRALCEEPLIGVSTAHMFAKLEVEGFSVRELQLTGWLDKYNVDASEIDTLVQSFVPLVGVSNPTEKQYSEALKANGDYQDLASKLIFLLNRYGTVEAVGSANSTHHYNLVAGGLRADGVPEVQISNDLDSRDSLIFQMMKKTDECKPISVIAFNVGDKRPMVGEITDQCKQVIPPVETPLVTPPPAPPTEQKPKPTPTPTPSVWKDSPLRDPGPSGNAPDGGGVNKDSGPGKYVPPAEMEQPPSTPRVDPAPPAPVVPVKPSPSPAPTKDPAPAPTPQPEAPKPSAPETVCDPTAPGADC